MATTFIGSSTLARLIADEIAVASRSDAKVLITGESGVGKEVVARLIHAQGPRHLRPLVAVNCAGLPDSLLESELFGHAKGSFTGADRDKTGLLRLAHGGTVFLDEIGEMSPRMQALLLRFMESGEVQPVGVDRAPSKVDVRILAATHRDLRMRIRDGAFREDLFYRLNVVHVHVPPLRDRREDVRDLVAHFLPIFSARHDMRRPVVAADAMEALVRYAWPGNVRELKNVLERLVIHGQPTIALADLPVEVRIARLGDEATVVEPEEQANLLVARRLLARMLAKGDSFWDAVYGPFLTHDLTRRQVRLVVQFGLEDCAGDYDALLRSFNLGPHERKRFLAALRKHDCLVVARPRVSEPAGTEADGPK